MTENKRKSRGFWLRGGGCGFVILTCLSACFFLILNGVLIALVYRRLEASGSEIWNHQRISQTIKFAGPIVLLLIEWWLIDFLADLFRRPNSA